MMRKQSRLCFRSAESLSRSRITTGNEHHIVCSRYREADVGCRRGAAAPAETDVSLATASPCAVAAARRPSRKAHNSFSGDQMSFTSCCVEWQALEHLSVPSLLDTEDGEGAYLSRCVRWNRRLKLGKWKRQRCLREKKRKKKALTQFVLLFRFGSLFGIKVPDCDGIAVRPRRRKFNVIKRKTWIIILAKNNNVQQLMSFWQQQIDRLRNSRLTMTC